jgi:hypothetical protein
MTTSVRRIPRSTLSAAVSPDEVEPILESLAASGVIEGYEVGIAEVVVWGDLTALESRLQLDGHTSMQAFPGDYRADYYRACLHFMHTKSFRDLPALHRSIWRLHANGATQQQICFKLHVTPMKVRVAVKGARLAARLRPVSNGMPRGGGPGRPPRAPSQRPLCVEQECGKVAESKGLCMKHYLRERRRRNLI